MKARFIVYEIEHGGDMDASLADLQRAGCTAIVVRAHFEQECMTVECDLPDGITHQRQLALLVACL